MVNVLKKILDFGIYFEGIRQSLYIKSYVFQVYRNPILQAPILTTLEYVFGGFFEQYLGHTVNACRQISINKMMICRYTPIPPNLQHSIPLYSTSKVDTPFSLFNRPLAFPNPLIDKILYLKGIEDLLSIHSLLFAYTLLEKNSIRSHPKQSDPSRGN